MAHAFPPRTEISPERQSMLDDAMAPKLSRLTSRELIAAIGQGLDLLSQRFSDAPLTLDDRFSDAEDAWGSLKRDLLAELDFRREERIGGLQ